MFRAIATLRNLRLLAQSSQCILFTSPVARFGHDQNKYRIFGIEKTRSRHIKCANGIPPN